MLKNNKQREEYFKDDFNWIPLGEIPTQDTDLHCTSLILVKKLRDYPIIKILAHMSNYYFGEQLIKIGYYEDDENYLNQIYNLTENQCIAIMRREDMEEVKNEKK